MNVVQLIQHICCRLMFNCPRKEEQTHGSLRSRLQLWGKLRVQPSGHALLPLPLPHGQ
jgi:hypothetical protein